MQFSEKLNYLFELTHAEGKELAAALNITPPQISKMRRGARGLPRSKESAQCLADFFAKRCNSDFQRDALSTAMKAARIRNIEKDDELSTVLLDWLADEKDPDEYAAKRADAFLRQFGTMNDGERRGLKGDPRSVLTSGKSNFMAYYGNEGKRLAVENFLDYIAQRRQPCTINVLTDESISWLYDDAAFSRRFQSAMLSLTEQGCYFRRISGPIMDMDQAFESLNRWLPLYMTGKATSYYYKRMRDNLNRLTLFVVPGVAVLFSVSVGNQPHHEGVTFFTIDERTVEAMANEFENYLALCEPIMNVYTVGSSSKKMHSCMLDYESSKGNCMQRSNSLSFITMPCDVAITLHTSGLPEEKNDFLTSFAQRYKRFKANLEEFSFTDIIKLADLDAIMSERVVIPGTYVLGSEDQRYTVSGYLEHLRSVVYLLEHQPNYHAVLRRPDEPDDTIVYVKEGYSAILSLAVSPFSIFEVSERFLVDAFAELLRQQIPFAQSELLYRRAVVREMRALIEQIEKRIIEADPKR